MSFIQKIVTKFLPQGMVDSMRAESEAWKIRCVVCGFSTSVWEAGGIRFGAASKGKRTMIRCPQCNTMRQADVVKDA